MRLRCFRSSSVALAASFLTLTRTTSAAFTTHSSFSELIPHYDAFILDQFGVLHNGVSALEGAPECVAELHKAGKKLIILSNTSAPSYAALAKLPKFGLNPEHFVGAVTSGEEASQYVKATYGAAATPSRALFLTWDVSKGPDNPRLTATPQQFLEQCGNVEVTSSEGDADFVLCHGSEVWFRGDGLDAQPLGTFIEDGSFECVDPILEQCLERNLPLVCANPDMVVLKPSGDGFAHMPGKIAARYREMGGPCRIFGKPEVEHFEACIEKLGLDKTRVAHVGDSLHHDIAGAAASGIPNIFVTSGIHANDLKTGFGELPEKRIIQQFLDQEGSVMPTHIVSTFRL